MTKFWTCTWIVMTIDMICVLLVCYPTIYVTVSDFLSICSPLSTSVMIENAVLLIIWIEFYTYTLHHLECSKPYFVTVGFFISDWLVDYKYCWLVCRKTKVFFVMPVKAANGNKIIIITCFFVFCYLEHSCIASNNYRKHIIFVIKHGDQSLPFISWNRGTDLFLWPRFSC